MAPEYGILPSTEGAGLLPWSWATDELVRSRNYWVCTTRPDGRPHAMPVWGLWLDDVLLFSTGRASRKSRNLESNPAVVVHLESGDVVVILEGAAEEVTDAAWLDRIVEAYEAKYGLRPDPADPGSPFYAVRPHTAFAWRESDFPGSATRWRLVPGVGD